VRFIVTMKKIWLFFLFPIVIFSCNNKSNIPDVSDIKVDVKLERFEKDFFAIDTNHIPEGLETVAAKYPNFFQDFMENILGLDYKSHSSVFSVTKQVLSSYYSFEKEIEKKFSNTSSIEKDIRRGFQFVKYYFPNYKLPGLVSYIGPLDAPGVAMTRYYLAIGLQQFAGKDFPGYQTAEVEQMFPSYISRRFDPVYIPASCMKAVVDDLFPDKSNGLTLIEQIIEKGKQLWLLDKFMPETADSLKTGYTQDQLNWCKENEGQIWNEVINFAGDLYTKEPSAIQNYIGEAPRTQDMPQGSPGNIGPWVGWQIVKKFVEKNPSVKPAEVMNTPARKILDEAKYKPK
jgi:hypothetical protein